MGEHGFILGIELMKAAWLGAWIGIGIGLGTATLAAATAFLGILGLYHSSAYTSRKNEKAEKK